MASKTAAFDMPPEAFPDVAMVDKLTELGTAARAIEIVTVETPGNWHGLPKQVQAIVKHGETGPTFERLRLLFEDFRYAPDRRTGTAQVTTLQSFVALVNRHKDAHTAVFAKTIWPAPKLTAVIDYHLSARIPDVGAVIDNEERASDAPKNDDDGLARFCKHRVEYAFPITEEFKAWMGGNGRQMEQGEFALFLEEHVADLTAPMDQERSTYETLFKERFATPSELVDLSRNLEIHVGQKIKRQERPASGERAIVFESSHMTATGEKVDIPGIFMISVPAFVDGDPIRIPARLRYRMKDGALSWFYQLYRPEFWLRAQVQNDLLAVATETGLPTYEGAPEGSGA